MPKGPILVVEDNPQEAEMMASALSRGGVEAKVIVLDSGEDVVSYFEGQGRFQNRGGWPLPSMILLDLKLPGRSGLEVLEWVRTHADWRSLPIVVFTASRHPADMERSYELGANSFIVKPNSYTELVDVLSHPRPIGSNTTDRKNSKPAGTQAIKVSDRRSI